MEIKNLSGENEKSAKKRLRLLKKAGLDSFEALKIVVKQDYTDVSIFMEDELEYSGPSLFYQVLDGSYPHYNYTFIKKVCASLDIKKKWLKHFLGIENLTTKQEELDEANED